METIKNICFKGIIFCILIGGYLSISGYTSPNQPTISQDADPWKVLHTVLYSQRYGQYVARFSTRIKALEGKTIRLQGFMYPLETAPTHKKFVLSYYPISACFFCGGAGPESVATVEAASPIKYSEKKIIVEGTLRLTPDFATGLFYTLENAKLVK